MKTLIRIVGVPNEIEPNTFPIQVQNVGTISTRLAVEISFYERTQQSQDVPEQNAEDNIST